LQFRHHLIQINDSINSRLDVAFEKLADIIEQAGSEPILIHCHAGISRSATIVIAYLMRKTKQNLSAVTQFVKQKRPCIEPNVGFWTQLIEYQGLLLIHQTCQQQLLK